MAILVLFNTADSLSYPELQAATNIPPADLKRSLQSLACAKVGRPVVWRCSFLISIMSMWEIHSRLGSGAAWRTSKEGPVVTRQLEDHLTAVVWQAIAMLMLSCTHNACQPSNSTAASIDD